MSAQTLAASPRYKYWKSQQVTAGATEIVFPVITQAITVATGVKKPEAIFVQALAGNTGKIIIGITGVAANGSAGGFELAAGANMTLPVNDHTVLFHIATAASQLLQITYLQGQV